jgi:hypothetical protein
MNLATLTSKPYDEPVTLSTFKIGIALAYWLSDAT